MNDSTRYRTPRQRAILALVMLGILLLSVAVAWWFVRARGDDVRRGEDIIRRIRGNSLEHYWTDAPEVLWYLARSSSGRIVALRRISRAPVAEGAADGITEGYEGANTLYRLRGTRLFPLNQEWWRISTGATRGSYRGPAQKRGFIWTEIYLNDGRIRVDQIGPRALTAETTVPGNYIPEGLSLLAVRLVAAEGKPASFRTIINQHAIVDGYVPFAKVTMAPDKQGKVVAEMTDLQGKNASVYTVDEAGRITRIVERGDNGPDFRLVPEEEVRENFPGLFEEEEPEPEESEAGDREVEIQAI